MLSWAGRADEAMTTAEKSEKAFTEIGDLLNQARSMVKIAELLKAMGKKADAKTKATAALEFAKENPGCESIEAEAQALLTSMEEKKMVRTGGGGTRVVRKLVKKWRKKGGGGGGGAVAKGLDPGATSKKLQELVKNVIADDDEEIHDDTPFMDAGIDSLGSVQLVTDCSKAFQMPLAPSVIFDFPTIRGLCDHLVAESGSGGGAPAGGGGDDEWEEYEDYEDVEEAIEGGEMMIMEAAPVATTAVAAAPAASAAVAAKPKGLDPAATSKKLHELVKNVIADDDEEIHDDTPFMDAGIDSLGSVQLVTDCSKAFQMPLAPSVIFDFPTVRGLCDHLVAESTS